MISNFLSVFLYSWFRCTCSILIGVNFSFLFYFFVLSTSVVIARIHALMPIFPHLYRYIIMWWLNDCEVLHVSWCTFCSYKIRHQSRVHDYVVQCALSINLFNEKIFAVVWFFLAAVAVGTAISLVTWSARVMYWPAQIRFVRRRLRDFEAPGIYASAISNNRHAKTTLAKFVECYLRRDGLLIIRLMALNVGELAAAETLAGLWENYGPDKRLLGTLHAQSTGRASSGGGSDSTDRGGLEQSVTKRRRQVTTTATAMTTSGTVVVDNSASLPHVGCRTTTSRELVWLANEAWIWMSLMSMSRPTFLTRSCCFLYILFHCKFVVKFRQSIFRICLFYFRTWPYILSAGRTIFYRTTSRCQDDWYKFRWCLFASKFFTSTIVGFPTIFSTNKLI